jgi:hypothetical protein
VHKCFFAENPGHTSVILKFKILFPIHEPIFSIDIVKFLRQISHGDSGENDESIRRIQEEGYPPKKIAQHRGDLLKKFSIFISFGVFALTLTQLLQTEKTEAVKISDRVPKGGENR